MCGNIAHGYPLVTVTKSTHILEAADGAVLTDQLGTPKGRCDEHNGKFFPQYETKV
jgi:hypothetical protein